MPGCLGQGQRGLQGRRFPSAAKGLDELDRGNQSLTGQFRVRPLGRQGVAVGVHDFDVADDAGTLAVGGQIGGAAGIDHGPFLGLGLIGQMADVGKAVLDVTKGHEHLLTV